MARLSCKRYLLANFRESQKPYPNGVHPMKIFLSIFLIVGFLTFAGGNLPIQFQSPNYQLQTSYEHQTERPIQLVRLTPPENAKLVEPRVTVSASFEFLRGKRPIVPLSLRLLLDGVDVTEQSRIAATEDVPSSLGEILFEPSPPLASGQHTAEVRFANDQNEEFSYTWHFYVQ